jgi:hypothetical protein
MRTVKILKMSDGSYCWRGPREIERLRSDNIKIKRRYRTVENAIKAFRYFAKTRKFKEGTDFVFPDMKKLGGVWVIQQSLLPKLLENLKNVHTQGTV